MRHSAKLLGVLCLLGACLLPPRAHAQQQTVCTITINSADEKQSFRRFLSPDKYRFVELVERNRPDWLGSACEQKVSCDVLIVSGHHGEGNVFFSDALDRDEHLPIEELERVSCSGSCPTLFAHLKEVYLFGCNTLNSTPQHTLSGELQRSLAREGRSPEDAARLARLLGPQRGESSRDRMRLLFPGVPVIYGFSGVAPLGPIAGSVLNRHFQSGGTSEVGKGRPSSRLLRQFSAHGMVATRGIAAGDPLQPLRSDVCTFADDRLSPSQRLASVHQLLQRPVAESRLLLDRLERFTGTLDSAQAKDPELPQALEQVARDSGSRERYLAFARDADQLDTRARMIEVAHDLGWLTPQQRRDEFAGLVRDVLARKDITGPEVDLACKINDKGELDALAASFAAGAEPQRLGQAAVLACMGSAAARERVLQGLASDDEADVRIAQAYIRQRPISDPDELRGVTRAIAAMNAPEAQARALDALARHYVADRESVDTLKHLFAKTRSSSVQNAIAGVLLRAERRTITPELLRTLRDNRLQASQSANMVDALIRRLQESS